MSAAAEHREDVPHRGRLHLGEPARQAEDIFSHERDRFTSQPSDIRISRSAQRLVGTAPHSRQIQGHRSTNTHQRPSSARMYVAFAPRGPTSLRVGIGRMAAMRYCAIGDSFTEGVGTGARDGTPEGLGDGSPRGSRHRAPSRCTTQTSPIPRRLLMPIARDQLPAALALDPLPTTFSVQRRGTTCCGRDMTCPYRWADPPRGRAVLEGGRSTVLLSAPIRPIGLPFGRTFTSAPRHSPRRV